MLTLGPAPRILIVRLSAIGDCIHTTPLATALRERFPGARIVWATQPGPASLIEGHPAVDQVVRVDRRWLRCRRKIAQLRRTLMAEAFDVALDVQSLTKSALVAWLSGARHRIAFSRGQGRELSPWLATQVVAPEQAHVVDRYLELLGPLGIRRPPVRFDLPEYVAAGGAALPAVDTVTAADGPFALLNPGAGWPSKCWPHQRYAEVASHLAQRGLRSVVLWAGAEERSWAEEIVSQGPAEVTLAPSTSLPELGQLCRRATLFVGSDTGPLHLAAAVGTPCVALFGPTDPQVCGPYGEQHIALQSKPITPHTKMRRSADNSALQAITAAQVGHACDEVLRRQESHRAA